MNTVRHDEVHFTDNLCKAYRSYQTLKDFACCAKTQTQYIKSRLERFQERINELRQAYYKQNGSVPKEEQKTVSSLNDAFVIYFQTHNEVKAQEFDGGGIYCDTRKYKMTEEALWEKANSAKESDALVYLNFIAYSDVPLMGDLKSEWDIRCKNEMLEQVLTMKLEDLEVLLFYLTLIARGIFFLHKFIGQNPSHQNWTIDPYIAYSIIFCEAFNAELGIVGAVLPERIPVAFPQKDGLKEFQYRQFVQLHQLWNLSSIMKANKSYQYHISDEYRADPDRYTCFTYYNVNLRHDIIKAELQVHLQYKHLFNGDFISFQLKPMKIFKWMLKEPAVFQFVFRPEQRRWVFDPSRSIKGPGDAVVEIKTHVKVQEKVLKQMDSEKTSEKLVQILDLMPTIQIKLSKLQKSVVASNQNMLCLGRSGTGKTTTSVLRLFAQEILYTILKKQQDQQPRLLTIEEEEKKAEKKQQLIQAKDLEKNTGMKMVFITASPVLTNEVRRYYASLKKKLIHFLRQRDERIEQRRAQFQNITEQEAQQIIKEVIEEHAKEEQQIAQQTAQEIEKKEILEFLKNEEKNLADDLEIENEMNIPNSYDELKANQFPLFITVKRLVYMMDACLSFSFFSRDHNNNIIGLDSNLGWHNESKGVMMINHYFKESIDYDEQLAKFGKELMEIEKDVDIVGDAIPDEDDDLGLNFKIIKEENQQDTASKKTYSSYNNRVSGTTKFLIEKQQLSFEVDYDIFESKFWPKIAHRRCLKKLSPTLVWTEIYSVIKGGMSSSYFYQGYLPKKEYVKKEGSYFLNVNEKILIYFIFLEYERWKSEQNAYDFMDIVNHLSKRLYHGDTIKRMSIDYLMVDEVQDLTPKTLQILLKLTSHKVFFAGDTAQTIAKGVGARFLDLRDIFRRLDFSVPQIVQLTKNYRSHGRILDLANSVVSLIELLFPKTIDKLVKEESEMDGLKPLVIMPLDQFHLRTFFTGTAVTSSQGDKQQLAAPQFGCNQVLIVRDQAAKDYIPDIFKNMLCLTVYEAKGLEFDDVILYNFFHMGDVGKSQWKLLNDIQFREVQKIKYDADLLDFDALDPDKFEEFMKEIKKQERVDVEYQTETELFVSKHRDEEVYRKFTMLCIEMKFLYVAITRPKRRLIIYDDGIDGRRPIQNYWEKCGVIDVVTKEQIQKPELLNDKVKEIFMSGQLVNERSSIDQWRIQGIKLFKKKYYDAAIQCFRNSGDEDLVQRCKAYQEADLGTAKMSEADSSMWKVQVTKQMSKVEKRKLIKEAKKDRNVGKKHFENAGFLFESIKMLRHSASCFFTARNYVKAAEIFEQLELFGQAAECLMSIEELSKAARLYEKAGLVTKSIECYEANGDWEQLLHCLHRNKDFFKDEERQSLINKYVPVALNSLYKLYSSEDQDGDDDDAESNRGKMQEMKIKMKYQKKTTVIAEEDEEDSDESGEDHTVQEDQAEDEENEEAAEEEKGEAPEDDKKEDGGEQGDDEEIEVIEEEYDLLDEVFQLKKHKSEQEEEKKEGATEMIDTTTKQKKEEEQVALETFKDDFEHLSQYDPDDEFLRSSKSVSIIDSILSKKSVSKTSDFSIISSAQSKKIESVISLSTKGKNTIAIVESNRDIYAEDVITQKIIYYISLFSEDVSSHLSKIRSKKILFSNNSELKDNAEKQEDLFIFDLDDVDTNFVNLILDVLEYYELFRLCLMLCNRYHMSERLGRYLVSVCSKYSNMHIHRFNLKLLRNQNTINEFYLQKQRLASIISHEALHNVFTLIEAKFLQLKQFNEPLTADNSLGIETYRTMLDLGFWKKLVYIGIDCRTAFSLCYKFFDRTNFDLLNQLIEIEPSSQADVVQKWRSQLVVREFWLWVFTKIRDVKEDKYMMPAIKEAATSYKETATQEELGAESFNTVNDMTKIFNWIYTPQRKVEHFIKTGQKINAEQEEKLIEKVYALDEKENNEVYEILQKHGALDHKNDSFNSRYFSFLLAAIPGTPYYQKFLNNIKGYFDKESIESLIQTYTQCIQILNLDAEALDGHSANMIEALYSVFLLSSVDSKEDSDGLFKHYHDAQMIMMNVNSQLFKDIAILQQSVDGVQINSFMAKKMAELRPRYFQVKNFRSAFIKEYKDFQAQFNQKKAVLLDKNIQSAFIVDMDSQFLMVPRNWVTKLIIIKLLNLCISLANELRIITQNQGSQEESKETEAQLSFEQSIEKRLSEMLTIQRVNSLAADAKKVHETYAEMIEKLDARQMNQLGKNPEFSQLLESYRQRLQFNCIKFTSITNNSKKLLYSTSDLVSQQFYLLFDFGLLYKRGKIVQANEIITTGLNEFKKALELDVDWDNIATEEEDLHVTKMKYRFKGLLKAFANFIVADEYEILSELIRGEQKKLKQMKIGDDAPEDIKQIVWLLQKIMIALDIHFYLRSGSIKSASKSMIDFVNTFSAYLTYQEKIKILSNVFYMLSTSKYGELYMPDYGVRFLDYGFTMNQYYEGKCWADIDVLMNSDYCEFQSGETLPFEEDERYIYEIKRDDTVIETITDDALYVQVLTMIVKILENINKDERSAFFKSQYIQIFNILMTVCVNETKKSSKIVELLSKGFELICNSSYDEYFQHSGLTEFNYSNASGFNDLFKQFRECEDDYKHQFFASARFGGFQLAHIDIKKCQTKDAQTQIQKNIEKAQVKEVKKMASHYYLSQVLKKKIKQRRHHYLAIKRAKENFIYEDRALTKDLHLYNMLTIERIPSKQVLDLFTQLQKKHASYRQLIVCKFAVNSLDTHYILAKANEIHQLQCELLEKAQAYVNGKGQILKEFEDVQGEASNEMVEVMNQAKLRYLEIESEVNTWMNQKAEPNLIEVERKSCKYKIKWESLRIYDKRMKIRALAAKRETLGQTAAASAH